MSYKNKNLWLETSLSNIANIVMGQSPPGESYNEVGEGLPFFQGKVEFTERHPIPVKWCTKPTKIAEPNDILLSVRAPVGPTNLANQKSCIGRGLAAIRANDRVAEQFYIYYFFKHIEPLLSRQGQGSTFAAINRSEIESLIIPRPPLSEQLKIVEILDQAYALREKRSETEEKAKKILPALFYKMFGDTNNSEWKTYLLGDITDLQSGGTPSRKKPEYFDGQIPWITTVALDKIYIDYEDANEYITEKAIRESSTCLIPKNSLLLGTRVGVGKASINDCDICTNQDIAAINFKDNKDFIIEYLFGTLKFYERNLIAQSRGATIKGVTFDVIKNLKVPKPPLPLQVKFAESLKELHLIDNKSKLSAQSLEKMWRAFLHYAFNGDLTAKWREGHMKELLEEMEEQSKLLAISSSKQNELF